MGNIDQALEYAKRANSAKTWKELMSFAIETDVRTAVVAAQSIIETPDHLDEIVELFECHQQ